ncbi:MAG: hypothetical protein U9Q92_01310 [archaeon]|nr:hypothetical protein [archaeon]
MRIMTMRTMGAYLVILVAIFAIINEIPAVFVCELSNYNCVFFELLKLAGLILALYLGSKVVL